MTCYHGGAAHCGVLTRTFVVDCAPVAEKEFVSTSTKYGAALRAQLRRPEQVKANRPLVATIALIGLSLGWVAVLVVSKHSHDSLPWVASFLISAASTGLWFYVNRNPASLNIFKIGENRWATLAGTLAGTLALFSAALGGWIMTHGMPPTDHIEVRRQVIDIILVSPKDYADNHDILPSTKPTEVPARDVVVHGKPNVVVPAMKMVPSPSDVSSPQPLPVKGEQAVSQSADAASRAASASKTRQANTNTGAKVASKKAISSEPDMVLRQPTAPAIATAPTAMVVRQPSGPPPAAPESKQPAPPAPGLRAARIVQAKPERPQMVLEEAAPAQMFEVTDSQSDKASEVAQNGGHSSGGSGSQTLLVTYLREVHRRIKKAWTPGTDDATSSAQIMFRIRKNGRLVSMKLIRSSGSGETDQSAMHAVTASAPFKPLPADFPAESLDLLYTFNYKVDSLTEVPKAQLE